ncbi:uncharacterized protein LOC127749150 [Frankliniella occidentalis]|uniref:Uncharacterized protein LOC127749150 n=1 Tax=Frankliniella occidentalis TaxID=133901 RepID=A0A9C6TXM6_FRAOC|nr:uncharacterized protein LOC127749150 [Frankliniella occidentalis]
MGFILWALLTFLCHNKIQHGNALNSFAGPYIIVIEERGAYRCDPPNVQLPWGWNVRPSHFNPNRPREKQLLTGNIAGENVSIDDSSWATIVLDSSSNNQWKENALVLPFKAKACTAFKMNMPTLYNLFYKKTETKGVCRLKPGVYTVKNNPIDWVFPNLPILPYGRFRLRATVGKAENLHACFSADLKIIPKT